MTQIIQHSQALSKELGPLRSLIEAQLQNQATSAETRPMRVRWGIHQTRQENEYMLRLKVTGGRLSREQFREAGRASKGSFHITTRQDIQYYGIGLAEIPELLLRLDESGLSSFLAGGNGVRTIGSPAMTELDPQAAFDPFPAALALQKALDARPEFQDLPRKFKISFASGVFAQSPAWFQDLGFHARKRGSGRGFLMSVGGGLGSSPQPGRVYSEYIPERLILAHACGVLAHFNACGERGSKHKARLKFLLRKEGMPDFMEHCHLLRRTRYAGLALPRLEAAPRPHNPADFRHACIQVPQGLITALQAESLSGWMESEGLNEVRLDWRQNLVIPWIRASRLKTLLALLPELNLSRVLPGGAADAVCCPGISSCGQARLSTRALSEDILRRLERRPDLMEAARDVNVAVSGCVNGCSQHLLASVGFQGGTRSLGSRSIPVYQLHLGSPDPTLGNMQGPAALIPARRASLALERLLEAWVRQREPLQTFEEWSSGLEAPERENILGGLIALKPESDELFMDNGADRPFQIARLGNSEC